MRNPYFDNAKLILIFLVVLGHLIRLTAFDNNMYFIYLFIYTFHMPAFILLSGYFSKNISNISKKTKLFIIYYLVFNTLYYLIFRNSIFMIEPTWIMWYLLSLISWNIMLTIFIKLKHPILLSIVIGVASGYFNFIGAILSLSHTLTFFPFFIIGYHLKEINFNKLNTFKIRILSIIIIILSFIFIYTINIPYKWLYCNYNYDFFGYFKWYAGIYRLGTYIISSLLCFALFSLIPHKKYFFTYMGANTLNTYLLHGIFVLLIAKLNIWNLLEPLYKNIIIITLAIVLTLILSSNLFNKIIHYIFNPPFSKPKQNNIHPIYFL